MSDAMDTVSPASDSTRREVLLRRLKDAQAILGCGDDPDRSAAIEEVERLERELAGLGLDPAYGDGQSATERPR